MHKARLDQVLALACILLLGASARDAAGAFIPVTTLQQKISSTGGCSLQEAIYSSILQSNIAITATLPDHFMVTQCVPGSGNDTIELPTGGVFQLSSSLDTDAYNFTGPTATPIIFSTITIEGNGATLEWTGTGSSRLFAVGPASIATPHGTVSGIGSLTLKNVYIKGFHVKGGDGVDGGGGGLGAGGAIYVMSGALTVENSTFDSNTAAGGNGAAGSAGGGGGLAGNGAGGVIASGGGGGSRGDGGAGSNYRTGTSAAVGGGGGGTVFSGGNGSDISVGIGGFNCGGNGGDVGTDGQDGQCLGGGGGGGGIDFGAFPAARIGHGGNGNYGGGGGGGVGCCAAGFFGAGHGGDGGFGGGGGGANTEPGGNGGFGGGGGSGSTDGKSGPFGGHADNSNFGTAGGGGGALGGAIFNDGGTVTVENSTFTNNGVVRGVGGSAGADNGADAGGAIFSHSGSLILVDATISDNQSTGSGGGIVVYEDGSSTSFTLDDTIIANNGTNECYLQGSVTSNGAGNLIMSNGSGGSVGGCPGVVTSGDPLLGPLQLNGGDTPTLALTSTSSPAFNTADSVTSLILDQRGVDRPQAGGFDIGAFELCLSPRPGIEPPRCIPLVIKPPPPTQSLTIQVSPAAGGTTTPAIGSYDEPDSSVIVLTAMPNPGYAFTNWTGTVADPTSASTTVTMDQVQTVTANFVAITPSSTAMPTPTVTPKPCVGDCNGDGKVSIDELVKGVAIALGNITLDRCPEFDCHGNGEVAIDCLVQAVNNALNECG